MAMYEQPGYQEGSGSSTDAAPGGQGGTGEYYLPPESSYSTPTYATAPPGAGSNTSFLLVVVGIIMMLVGWMVRVAIYHVEDSDAMELVFTLVDIFLYLGVAVLSIGLFHGAFKDYTLPDTLRTGMVVAAGIVVGFVASNSGGIASLLSMFW